MATPLTFRKQENLLLQQLAQWDRWWRINQIIRWLPYSLIAGLAVGVGLALVSRVRPFLFANEILTLTLLIVGGMAGGMVATLGLRPRSPVKLAQFFDQSLHLKERVSTALQLLNGELLTHEVLAVHQLNDAVRHAQQTNVQEALPLQFKRGEWAVVLGLLVAWAVLLWLPNSQETAIVDQTQDRAQIETASEALQDILSEVATDPNLDTQTRDSLLQELQTAIETLEHPNITPEEAFATVTDVESRLASEAEQLAQQLNAQQQALETALQSLQATAPTLNSATDLGEALKTLQESLDALTPSEQQAMASALERAMEALQNTQPQTADALDSASQALQSGDANATADALQRAQDALEAQQATQQAQQQSQSMLEQQANQADSSADNLQPSEGTPSSEGGEKGQPSPSQDGAPDSQGEATEGKGQAEGKQPGGQSPGEQGENAPGQQGTTPGDQPSQQGQPNQQGQGQSPNQQGGAQGQNGQGESGQGAGDGSNGEGEGGQNDNPTQPQNNPDGQGETVYTPRADSQNIGGENGNATLTLENDPEGSPIVEGDFIQNPNGQALVPYESVFSDYSDSARQALESDYIPMGMRDVIYDYFTSIEPGQ